MISFGLAYLLLCVPFTFFGTQVNNLLLECLLKIAPILFLMATVSRKRKFLSKRRQSDVFFGLAASLVGDIFIILANDHSDYLLYAIYSFGLVCSHVKICLLY